jgi:iron(III) transport system ATP-binding protein
MAASIAIKLSGISATFHHQRRGDITAVKNLDLEVKPGEFLTLLGSSGCGKTTTLRMIAGFQKPSAGRIWFGTEDVTDLAANARDIGFVFQNYALFPHLSVFENVAYGLRVKRHGTAEIEASVEAGLRQVGLQGMADRMINELSGGQQQRVALARAIAIKPRVLLFDEPLSNLDAQLRVQMRGEIVRLQKQLAITTIYVTHDQEEAMAISDRIAIMDAGLIAQIGTAQQLYRRPASKFVAGFLGSANLLRGVVAAVEGGKITLEILNHRWEVLSESPVTVGQSVDAVMRPEALTLAKAGAGLAGVVQRRTYFGDKAEVLVRVGTEVIQAIQWNPALEDEFREGEQVSVLLPAANVQLLAVNA